MTWSDRSASPARRWWDRVARLHARRGSKIREDDRSFFFLYHYLIPRERPFGRVSKDGPHGVTSWFETAQARLLTMRADNRGSDVRSQGGVMPSGAVGNGRASRAALPEYSFRNCVT